MRKHFYLLFIILLNQTIFAQKEIGISGGYATNGHGIMINYTKSADESGFTDFGLTSSFSIEEKDGIEIPYQTYTVSSLYYKKILKHRYEKNNLSLGVGGIGSYQRISSHKKSLDEEEMEEMIDAKGKLIYGVVVSGMFDYRIAEPLKVFVIATQNYHFNSDIKDFSFYGGIGIKYLFF